MARLNPTILARSNTQTHRHTNAVVITLMHNHTLLNMYQRQITNKFRSYSKVRDPRRRRFDQLLHLRH